MGSFNVLQRTSDGMFNATSLLQQWNNENGEEKRDISNFWRTTNLKELMMEIVDNENIDVSSVSATYDNNSKEISVLENMDFDSLKKILSRTSRANKGKNAGTWMHPVLFIKFSMYLSPRFEYHVLKFVSDELIKYRGKAGDEYRKMCSSLMKIVGKENPQDVISKVARALNFIVFNNHEQNARNNNVSENLMRELIDMETRIAQLIDDDFITSFEDLISYLRRMWAKKYQPKCLN